MVTNDSPENKTAAKLIAGYFKDVGVKVTLRVVDAGVLLDAQYNYKGDVYAPDYDMFIWYWTQDPDPSFMLAVPTKDNIEGWNDTLWWSPEYRQAVHRPGPGARRGTAHRRLAGDAVARLPGV